MPGKTERIALFSGISIIIISFLDQSSFGVKIATGQERTGQDKGVHTY